MDDDAIYRPATLRHGYRALLSRSGADGLVEAGDQWAGSDLTIGIHSHPCWELFLQLTDEPSRWDVAGQCHNVGRLQMLAVPPHTPHELLSPRPTRRWHFYYAAIDPQILLRAFPVSRAVWSTGLPVWFGDASACRDPFESFLREVNSTGRLRPDALQSTAAHLLISVSRIAQPDYVHADPELPQITRLGSHPSIARAQALLQARYDEPATMQQIARTVGLSPAHFTTLFTRETGTSPSAYRRAIRIRHAERLLRETRMSVAEIATTVGFSSAQHLATTIRAVLGTAPTRLRAESGYEDNLGHAGLG